MFPLILVSYSIPVIFQYLGRLQHLPRRNAAEQIIVALTAASLSLHNQIAILLQNLPRPLEGAFRELHRALIRGENEEKGGERPLIRSQTKTESGNRCLNLPADFCREMKELHKLQLERRLMFQGVKDEGYIFTKDEGQPINPSSFSSRYCWVRKRLGIGTTFHMLRHDMAVRMKKSHFDAKDAQFQLGHSTIQTTLNIYTHLDRDDKNAIGDWLQEDVSNLLTGKKQYDNSRFLQS